MVKKGRGVERETIGGDAEEEELTLTEYLFTVMEVSSEQMDEEEDSKGSKEDRDVER